MNEDQQIRAAAAQAAATLMAPVQPAPADYVAVAGVIEGYIRGGSEVALTLCSPPEAETASPPQPAPVVETPEESKPVPAPTLTMVPELEGAGMLPPEAQAPVSEKQVEARRFVEKRKKDRVASIMAEASVAKALPHKQRLCDAAEDGQLADYPVVVDGKPISLGDYLASL